MNLPILSHLATGVVNEPDCLRCSECVLACPAQSLTWPE
jgi:NAD-dependent dihydropyrimidine dehydrogenase PreA subunit